MQYQPLTAPMLPDAGGAETITVDKWLAQPQLARFRGAFAPARLQACVRPSTDAQGSPDPPTGWRSPDPPRALISRVYDVTPPPLVAPPVPVVPELVANDRPPRGWWRRSWATPGQRPQPLFGVEVDVPVMSWASTFPEVLPHFVRRFAPQAVFAWDTVLAPAVVPAPDYVTAIGADRMTLRMAWTRAREDAAPVEPPTATTPDVVTWLPPAAARLWARRRQAPVNGAVPDGAEPLPPLPWVVITPDRLWRIAVRAWGETAPPIGANLGAQVFGDLPLLTTVLSRLPPRTVLSRLAVRRVVLTEATT
jgi:hypothetical protein